MEGTVLRIIGMDIHRVAAEAVSLLDGEIVRLGRIPMLREKLEAFAKKELTQDDHVVIEATGNAAAVVDVLSPYVERVVIANPKQVRMIAHAKVKTDAIDAAVLAKLYASGFLPEVWVPDQRTLALRRQITRRRQLVRPTRTTEELDPVDPTCASDPALSAWELGGYQWSQMVGSTNPATG
jgi:transposase